MKHILSQNRHTQLTTLWCSGLRLGESWVDTVVPTVSLVYSPGIHSQGYNHITQVVSKNKSPSNLVEIIDRPSTYCMSVRKCLATTLEETHLLVITTRMTTMEISPS